MQKTIFSLLLVIGTLFSCDQKDHETRPPNIIFIMVDDLGKEWIGAYGAEEIKTPRIDALAKKGLLFHNAWSMPQCTPTRATLLTGQYPFRHGWVNHWDVPRWGAQCHFDPKHNLTFAREMRKAGYKTAIAGKWQINDFRVQPNVLDEHGFDDWCMWTGYEEGVPASAERYWDPYIHTREGSKTYPGEFGEDIFSDFLIDFMKKNKDNPMMLYYPMAITHTPLVTTPHELEVETKLDRHKAMVRYTDHLVGKIVDAVEGLGLTENTILIFTTDNGSTRGITGKRLGHEVKGGKMRMTQNGTAQPFIVYGPGLVPQGKETHVLTDFSDMFPTFLELAGTDPPLVWKLDGKSIAELILGDTEEGDREWILSMGSQPARLVDGKVSNMVPYYPRALANSAYKVIIGAHRKAVAFYHLAEDPFEENNLIESEEPKHKSALKNLMDIAANFPETDGSPRYDPNPKQVWDVSAEKINAKTTETRKRLLEEGI